MLTCPSTTWTPARRRTTTTRRRRRRGAAAPSRAPRARPRAHPLTRAQGLGPGKRVQVQGNARQNVSI